MLMAGWNNESASAFGKSNSEAPIGENEELDFLASIDSYVLCSDARDNIG